MAPVIKKAPKKVLQEFAHGISCWLEATSKSFEGNENFFLSLSNTILDMEHQDNVITDEPVMRAINHPVGHITQALLHWWYRIPLEDGQGLPTELCRIFTTLCDTSIDKYRHGRVLLFNKYYRAT